MSGSEAISPTAHYTGYVWARNGLSDPGLATTEGRVLYESLRPLICLSQRLGGASLEAYLLTRHRSIDALLECAVAERGITQVIEVACGMSPRGLRFAARHPGLLYIEADLPGMAARKRAALERIGSLSERHRVIELDALRDDGPLSLAEAVQGLDRSAGLAIVTEGLLGYLDGDAVNGVWERFAATLDGFRSGFYISDLHIGAVQNAQIRVFRVLLAAFVRGRVHLHFGDPDEAEAALRAAGFASATVRLGAEIDCGEEAPRNRLVHILEASTT